MIYEIIKTIDDNIYSFEIDDLISFKEQDAGFMDICNRNQNNGEVYFDNAIITLLPTGRVLITYKNNEGYGEPVYI